MITFQQVGMSFNKTEVLSDVTFHIEKGEIVALLGPNGAGKSTTIQLLLGLRKPTHGELSVFGEAPGTLTVREKIGVMLQDVSVLDLVTVRELLLLVQGYYKNALSLDELVTLSGLDPAILPMRTEKLSGGQKRRVNFALALVGNPELLVLDEPTVGMDAPTRKTFWKTIAQLAKQGTTVVFTTHYLEEAESTATRILLVEDGKLIQDATPAQLKQNLHLQQVSFQVTIPLSEAILRELSSTDSQVDGTSITLFTEDADQLLKELIAFEVEMKELTISRETLEDAYTALTTRREAS